MLSQALYASFADTADQRVADRRVLRLEALAATPAGDGAIRIHNLSRTGMLGECATSIPVGTAITVELPGGAHHAAQVVWCDSGLFGCRFNKPISQATLSAALLRAAPIVSDPVAAVVDRSALARLREHWAFEDEVMVPHEALLPLGERLWVIIGLGVAAWAAPTALIVWLFA